MYNLLLIDDEVSILEGLYNNIDWQDIGIDDVFTANNAAQALLILTNNRVDVVISDIRMPEMDGLQISSILKDQWPHAKVILLSGYKEFEFAQKAVELGVFSYIVKPVSYDDLIQIVEHAIEEIEEDLKKLCIIDEARNKMSAIITVLQEHFLLKWIVFGKNNLVTNNKEMLECDLKINSKDHGYLLALRFDENIEQLYIDSSLQQLALKQLAQETFEKDVKVTTFVDLEENIILLLNDIDAFKLEKSLKYTKSILSSFQLSVRKTLGCIISIFWDEILPISDMHESYKRLVMKINNRISYSVGAILGLQDSEKGSICNNLYKYPYISMLIETMQKEEIVSRIKSIFDEIRQKSLSNTDTLLEVYHVITGTIITDSIKRNIQISQWGNKLNDFFTNMNEIKSLKEFESQSIKAVLQYFDYVIEAETQKVSNLTGSIQAYISSNLNKAISVTMIANYYNYNSNYLSKLFKKETGITIQDYILNARIEEAKYLLKQPRAKVCEVSEQVGYENVSHFSRLFKKLTGVSPKDYQSMCG